MCRVVEGSTPAGSGARSRPHGAYIGAPEAAQDRHMIRPSRIVSATVERGRVIAVADQGHFRLTAYAAAVIHVAYFSEPEPIPLDFWGLQPRPLDAPALTLEETEDGWCAVTADLRVLIARAAPLLTFQRGNGDHITDLRMLQMGPVHVGGEDTHQAWAAFGATREESYYGLGQHQNDVLDHDHHEVSLAHDYQAPGGEIIGVPFMISNRHYGVVWDNPSRSQVTPGGNGRVTWWSEVADAVSFFLIAGDCADAVYAGYRVLTGPTPLPPLAALGYIQCKQRYQNRDELLDVARTYRTKQYPCDILVVDWFHWRTLGDMDLDPRYWPDPAGMNAELADMGFRVMISCWPRFMADSTHYPTLEERGWFMHDADGETVYGTPDDQRGALLDTTHPGCAAWYWATIRDSYGARGFSSWWTDENEPDICPYHYRFHAGSGARLHNLYPYTHSKAIYDGHRCDRDDRCLILSHSAYHGAQTCGTTFWSSDIHPTWDVFRRQIPCGLNFCATGFAWWSSDIGGWHEHPALRVDDAGYRELLLDTGESGDGTDDLRDYVELYVRWFQYGAFCPTFRAHGTRPHNEVWSFGGEAERIMHRYLELRYRLLPYLYAQAWRTTCTGAPFMRALFMDFPDDPAVRDCKDAYLFGPSLLVAPVTRSGARERAVYLPRGVDWYDFWTGAHHAGGQTLTVPVPLDTLPLFVRAGSILPLGEVVPHTGVEQRDLRLRVYPGADARCCIYRDDGRTYAYEQGAYSLTELSWDDAAGTLRVDRDPDGLFPGPIEGYREPIA